MKVKLRHFQINQEDFSPVEPSKRSAKGSSSTGRDMIPNGNSDYQEGTKNTRNGKLWVNIKDFPFLKNVCNCLKQL